MSLRDIDTVILCGGQGTRLRAVLSDKPKVLAPIDGRPYLDWLLDSLKGYGLRRVMLCGGHLSEVLAEWVRGRKNGAVHVSLFNEPEPHGTAGALRFMRPYLRSDPVMVINGDTLVTADLARFLDAHLNGLAMGGEATTLVGTIWRSQSLEYAGHYLFSQYALAWLMETEHEMLHDFMEGLQGEGKAVEYVSGCYLDIGTPEDLALAPEFLREARHDHHADPVPD